MNEKQGSAVRKQYASCSLDRTVKQFFSEKVTFKV